MTNKLNLPASYAVMNEEEMTYTQGGSALGAAATVVGAVVLGSSYLWGIFSGQGLAECQEEPCGQLPHRGGPRFGRHRR